MSGHLSCRLLLAAALGTGLATPAIAQPEPANTFEPSARLGMAFQFYTIDYVGGSPVAAAYPVGWNRVLFLPTARVNPALGFKGRFAIDNFGLASGGLGSGHIRSSGMDTGSPFYVDWAYVSFTPEGLGEAHVGLLNLDRELKLGAATRNPFDASPVYSITLTRYGGVGTPPLTAAGGLDAGANRPGYWHMGTNVALETIDPNSTFANFPAPALSALYQGRVGGVKFALATMDGTPGANPARAHDPAQSRTLYLPANFPEAAPQRQGYSVAMAEGEVAGFRVQGSLRADNQTFGTLAGKHTALTVERQVGPASAALTLAGAGAPVDTLGAWVWAPDVGQSGWGAGLGLKARGMGVLRPSGFDFLSVGPVVRAPAWWPGTPLTIAVQQTMNPTGAIAAGVTLETAVKPHPMLPDIGLEYSLGKFDPAGPNALLDPASPFTHQLYSVFTTFAF